MENKVLQAIFERRSIRAYTDEALTAEELDLLKAVALASPTASNKQNQRFLFITNRSVIADIEQTVVDAIVASGDAEFIQRIQSRGNKVVYDAPLIVIVFGAPSHYAAIDAGIAVENLAIAAKGMGLDSVILGMLQAAFKGESGQRRQKQLGVSDEYAFMIAIAIGHPNMDKEPHESDSSHIIVIE